MGKHDDDVLCLQCTDGAKPCTCGYRKDAPLFREMKMEELDYGPSWGVILAIIALGFVAVNVIIVVLSFSA